MANDDDRDGTQRPGRLNRRSVLAGGAATAATAALPRAALGQPKGAGGITTRGAVYMDPDYLKTFNDHAYSSGNIKNVQTLVKSLFSTRGDLKWGFYQRDVEPDPKKWGRTPQIGQAAFDHWPDFSQEARDDLEKLPASFSDTKNAMNPFDTRQVAANLLEHLDEVIRIALWDKAVPIKIKVEKNPRRHHGLTTEWDPAPQPGLNPNLRLNGLTINIDCPDGGWQGYTLWRNRSTSEHITKFVATWVVPSPPANDQGQQIIFIFNGLESASGPNGAGGILQPVLQWTNAGWFIRSWYLTADFDPMKYPDLPDATMAVDQDHLGDQNRCYSKALQVMPGDIITGTVEGGRDASGKFNYLCSLSRNNQPTDTKLMLTDIPELTYAVCAVESYKVTAAPADYPNDPVVMSSVELQIEQNPISPIQWKESKKAGRDFTAKATMAGRKVEFKLI